MYINSWFNTYHKVSVIVSIILILFTVSFSNSYLLAMDAKHIHHNHSSHHLRIVTEPTTNQSNHHEIILSKTNNATGLINTGIGNNTKVVILTFGDTMESQFTTAKPILDQYGFKASFFITCNYVEHQNGSESQSQTDRLTWNDIQTLQQDGQDIESKGMTHTDLNNLSPKALDFEIGGSKQCLESHGINSDIFAVVHGDAWNNPLVIDTISKYYGYADNGFANSIFLHCDGYSNSKQTDCRVYDGGVLNYANRYSIREESHNSWDQTYAHNDKLIFQKFVQEVNSAISFNNKKGMIDAIPIVAYHGIDDIGNPSSTDVNLFATEMKYLHDNGFDVIPMSDLGYNQTTNFIYIK